MVKASILVTAFAIFLSSCETKTASNKPTSTYGSNDSAEASEAEVKDAFSSMQADSISLKSLPDYKTASNKASKKDNLIPKASESLRTLETAPGSSCTRPTRIADLNGGVTFKVYKFDDKMSASATAMGFSGEIGRNQMVFIQDFIRYTTTECNGTQQRIGIGLRCFIHVTSFKGKLGATLPTVAANVELERAKASYELTTLGFGVDGRDLVSVLDPQGEYNVQNFGKLAIAFNKVLGDLNADSNKIINPVILP